jgi:hypothetical protein
MIHFHLRALRGVKMNIDKIYELDVQQISKVGALRYNDLQILVSLRLQSKTSNFY